MSTSRIAIRRIAALSGPRAQASLLGARPFTSLGETLTIKVSAWHYELLRLPLVTEGYLTLHFLFFISL